MVQDKIQWLPAVIWFRIGPRSGLHSLGSGQDPEVDCIHLIEGRIQWWTAVIWLRVGFSGGLGSYGSGKDPVVDCIHLVQDRIQWELHSFEDPVCGLPSYASGRIQWWTAVIWFKVVCSGGLQSFGSGQDSVVDCIHLVQDRIQWWTVRIIVMILWGLQNTNNYRVMECLCCIRILIHAVCLFVDQIVGWLVRQPFSGHYIKYVVGLPFKL